MAVQIYGSATSFPLDNERAFGGVIAIFAVDDIGQGATQARRRCSNPNRRLPKLRRPVPKQGLRRK
jgi:hypothetical protein